MGGACGALAVELFLQPVEMRKKKSNESFLRSKESN